MENLMIKAIRDFKKMKLGEILKSVKNVIDEEEQEGTNAGFDLATIERIKSKSALNRFERLLRDNENSIDACDYVQMLLEAIYYIPKEQRLNYIETIIELYEEE